jgi:hypothetical protein
LFVYIDRASSGRADGVKALGLCVKMQIVHTLIDGKRLEFFARGRIKYDDVPASATHK